MSRIINAEVYLSTLSHGTVHLAKGTAEADIPQWLLDERTQRYVAPIPGHLEDTADPLIDDSLWTTV